MTSMREYQLIELNCRKKPELILNKEYEVCSLRIDDIGSAVVFRLRKIYHSNMFNSDSIIACLQAYYKQIDTDILKSPNRVCCKGCSDCCVSDFEISITEYFMILNYLNINYGKEYVKRMSAKAKLTIPSAPCIFVNDTTRACDIYEVRPLICRKYGLYNTAMRCEKLSSHDVLNKYLDTTENTIFFKCPEPSNKTFELMPQTITYWFANMSDGEFASQKMQDLYSAAFNNSVDDFVKLILL